MSRLLISWHLVCCLWEWSRSAGCPVTSLLLCLNAWEIHVKLGEMFHASGLQRTAFHADGVSGLSLNDWMMKCCIKCIKNMRRHIRKSLSSDHVRHREKWTEQVPSIEYLTLYGGCIARTSIFKSSISPNSKGNHFQQISGFAIYYFLLLILA